MRRTTVYNLDIGKERKSKSEYYLIAAFLGVAAFIILLLITKGLIFVGKIVIEYWIWILIGIVILLVAKKILSKKVMVMKK